MLDLFRNMRVDKYTRKAGIYLDHVYKPEPKNKPKPKAETKPSPKPEKPAVKADETSGVSSSSNVRYSSSEESKPTAEYRYSKPEDFSNIRHSLPPDENYSIYDDNYNFDRIFGIMRNADMYSGERIGRMVGKNLNATFSGKVKEIISRKSLRDSDVYKAALMDRRLFSKIMSDNEFHPSKDTALSLIFAMRLTLTEAEDLLSRAGYTLSHSNKRDVILEYFIREGVHNLIEINMVLFNLGQKTIG